MAKEEDCNTGGRGEKLLEQMINCHVNVSTY